VLVRVRSAFALAVLLALVAITWPSTAMADPEGGTASLRAELDEAVRGYLDARNALEASKTRQAKLTTELATAEAAFAAGQEKLGKIAASAYRTSGFHSSLTGAIVGGGPKDFLDRVTVLNGLSAHEHAVVAAVGDGETSPVERDLARKGELTGRDGGRVGLEAQLTLDERAR